MLIRIALGLGLDIETTDELIAAAGHLPLLRPSVLYTRRAAGLDGIASLME